MSIRWHAFAVLLSSHGFRSSVAEFGAYERTAKRRHKASRVKPDAETVDQAKRYRDSLPARPGWDFEVETAVVEVYANRGYRWFLIA